MEKLTTLSNINMNTLIFVLKDILTRYRESKLRLKAYKKYKFFIPRNSIITNIDNIVIGSSFGMNSQCYLFAQDTKSSITIGDNVKLNLDVMINADMGGKIKIGNNVLIGPGVKLRASNHNFSDLDSPIIKQGHESGTITIEDNVWIGANVVILPNTTIKKGSIIAAGSVVTKDTEQNTINGGVPNKLIRTRTR